MKLYWRARDIPELSGLREPVLRVAFQACVIPVCRRHIWLAVLAVTPLAMAGQVAGTFVSQHHFGFAWSWAPVLCGVLGGLVGCQIFIQFAFERSRPQIKKYLENLRDV